MKVKNLVSAKGTTVANQFSITNEGKTYFQSYNSLIAEYDGEKLTLGRDWAYSRTTLRYLYIWMEDNCYWIYSKINETNNKKRAIENLINLGVITYNGGMV